MHCDRCAQRMGAIKYLLCVLLCDIMRSLYIRVDRFELIALSLVFFCSEAKNIFLIRRNYAEYSCKWIHFIRNRIKDRFDIFPNISSENEDIPLLYAQCDRVHSYCLRTKNA